MGRRKRARYRGMPRVCPKCQNEMRIVSLIDDPVVIERILRHPGPWVPDVHVLPARAPPEIAKCVSSGLTDYCAGRNSG